MKRVLSVFLSAIIFLSVLTMFTSCIIKDNISSVNFSSEMFSDETEESINQKLIKDNILKIEDNYKNELGFVDEEDVQPLIDAILDDTEKNKEKIELYEEGSESVYIQFKNGLGYLYQPDIQGYQASGNNIRIVTMQPFYSEMSNTVTFKDPDKGAEAFCKNLSNASFDVEDSLSDEEVTIDSILNLKGSSVILWDGHGGYDKTIHSCLELSIPFKNVKEKYPDDCYKRNIIEYKNGNAILTAGFFDEHFKENDFENAVIYLGGCHTAEDDALANVFINKGAKCVFGNTGKVLSNYNENMIISVSEYLSKGKTASDALKEAQKENALSHLFFWSEVKLFGDQTFAFIKLAASNGSVTTPTINKMEAKPKNPEILTATEDDFKKLEELLNKDGGYILNNDFNYKTASRDEFFDVAQSYGYVPAYHLYVNENAFSAENLIDIDNDGYMNMTVPTNAFNWVLKNVYNFSGKNFSQENDGPKYTFKGNNVYFGLPPDEGGVYGKLLLKSYSEKNGVYTVKYDYYTYFDPFVENPELVYNSTYTVSASLKNVESYDKGDKIKVWSIYSIEKS